MSCDAYRNRIEAYLDAELPESEERETFRHISDCRACGQEALAALHTKRLVKGSAMRYTPSAEFRARVLGSKSAVGARRPYLPRLRWALAAVALAMVVAAAAWFYRPATGTTQLADLHVTMLASANPFDVVSSDRHTVKPWFQGKLPFAFDLPDLPDATFRLAGGRLVYVEGRPAAQLVYLYGRHNISVFVTRQPTRTRTGNYEGFSVVSWERNGLTYTAVSDASRDTVEKLAAIFGK